MTSNEINNLVQHIFHDKQTTEYLRAHSLGAYRVAWEDTARTQGTTCGPNISDMTLSVDCSDEDYSGADMPVIRSCNFIDDAYDTPIENINLIVDIDGKLVNVCLQEYLKNFNKFIGSSEICNLYDNRDTTVITSAQCCVLPCKEGQKTEFCVRLFNYQTTFDTPVVLVIISTHNGTSAQVLDHKTSDIMFNKCGIAHNFAIERLTNVCGNETSTQEHSFTEITQSEANKNVILIIQIPLVVPDKNMICEGMTSGSYQIDHTLAHGIYRKTKHTSGMGFLSLGKEYGRFKGTRGLTLVRDPNFPIRLTKQYYRVTDESCITEHDIIDIAKQLKQDNKTVHLGYSIVNTAEINNDIGRIEKFGSLVVNTTKRNDEPILDNTENNDNIKLVQNCCIMM